MKLKCIWSNMANFMRGLEYWSSVRKDGKIVILDTDCYEYVGFRTGNIIEVYGFNTRFEVVE